LGAETHTKVDQQVDDDSFIPDPTAVQIKTLDSLFADLGGVVMTEVDPQGDPAQKSAFMTKIDSLLAADAYLWGAILWNVYDDPGDSSDKTGLMVSRFVLFNSDGTPTQQYYSLLH
jgi:hypothetical protein